MSKREESERSRHEQRLSRTFDEVMKLGEFSDTAGSGCSSGSNDQGAGRGEDSEGSGREERNDRAGEEALPRTSPPHTSPPRTSPPRTSPPDTLSGAGQGGGGLEDELDGLPVFGVDEEEEDWHFALPMDTLAELDIDRPHNRADEPADRQKGALDDLLTDGRADEGRGAFMQGDSRGSAYPTHTPSPDSLDGAVLHHSEGGGVSPSQKKRSETDAPAPADRENPVPPVPPLVNIKDEPVDEGYDCALLPQSSSLKQIKEELEHQEDVLRISSVYSVGGGNSYVSPTAPAPAPQTPSILGGGRSLAPAPAVQPAAPPPQAQPPPSGAANPSSVRCSGCSKVLLKGQTAYQRKGSTQLFCSTVCLTGFLPNTVLGKTCHQCLKDIENPKNLISVPMGTGGAQKDFCSQFCLSVFNRRKKNDFLERPSCSVCKRTNRVQHEVTYQGTLHRLCSDHCFSTWRHYRQLAMNCCESCGMYCNSKGGSSQVLTIGDHVTMRFCSPTCIGTYKQTCSSMMDCAHCKNQAVMSSMLVSNDLQGKVRLYCSSPCVSYSRPPQHVLTGTAFPCTHCRVSAVPQYHLAMVDGSIRNFCSHDCVTTFRSEQSKALVQGSAPPPGHMNGSSTNPMAPPPPPYYDSLGTGSAPYGHPLHPSFRPPGPGHPYAPGQSGPAPHLSTPGVARTPGQQQQGVAPLSSARPTGPVRLTCNQCSLQFCSKPELFLHKGRIFQFCGKQCCDQFRTQKNIIMKCEYCLLEKVVKDLIMYNHRARAFCSESCKLLFKHDLSKKSKESPWRSCAFCSGICQNTAGQKMIHSHFGGKMEEFCKPDCMSMFTVLFYEMARCDNCRRQGKMAEQLRCSGTIRHFCNMDCVLQYCYRNIQNPIKGSAAAAQHSKMAPVIADVVSLANTPAGQPNTADTPLTGALPTSNSHGKSLDDASTQTDAMRPPFTNRRNMKNKAILCKPFTRSQDTMCHLPSQSTDTPAGFSECTFTTTIKEEKVKVVVLPVPVPVFIPVPMNMYSQYTPVPMMMPVPVPVPMVLHPTLSDLESRDKKDLLIQSQSMAEEDEDVEKDKPISHGDQGSTYSGDLESEAVSTPLSWEEESTSAPSAQLGTRPETVDPPSMMDLEADMPTECFDSSRWTPSASVRKLRLAGRKRPRDTVPPSKRSRHRTSSGETSHRVVPPASRQLQHMYGVEAWKSWVLQSSLDPPPDPSSGAVGPVVLKQDVLQCDSSELSYGLCRFIREVRRPGGQNYSPDSVFYLCLGIQQYLFKNGRIENIFTDEFYNRFTMEITRMLEHWSPTVLPSGSLHSRVEEDFLWECKQLGAYSPTVLLNTLIFFSAKVFRFTGPGQHRRLSFANFTRCTRLSKTGKMAYLRFRPPRADQGRPELLPAVLPAKRKMEEEEGDMEMPENIENPLRCPVRLYLFYLSKCSESVRKRDDLFYLQPVVSCHPNSPQWYSSQPLEGAALDSMLTRILAVRQVHLDRTQLQQSASNPSSDDDSSQ